MTFLQLCQETRRECGIQGSGPTTVVSQTGLLQRVVDWVADADEYIQSLYHDWDFLHSEFTEDTVLGAEVITKPEDFGAWDRESFGRDRGTATGRQLTVRDYKEWRKYMGAKTNSEPFGIIIKPNKDLVLPYPADGVYEIYADYWATPTRMTVDDSLSDIPAKFHRLIIAKAKMYWYEDQEFITLYQTAEKEYKEWLDKLEMAELPGQHFRAQGEAIPMAASSR